MTHDTTDTDCIEDNVNPRPATLIINRVTNVEVNVDVKPTGMYDTQGCCTKHVAPCVGRGTTCQLKE